MRTSGSSRVAFLLVGSLLLGSMLACQLGSGSPPTVEITFPPTGGQVLVGREVPIHSVSQDDRGITRVELWSGGQVIETTTAPGTGRTFVAVQHWTATEVGVFNVGVRAVDSEGQPSQPTIITIQAVAAASEITQPLPDEPAAPAQLTTVPSGPTTQPDGPPPPPEGPSPIPGEPVDLELWNLTLSNLTPAVGEEIVVGVTILNNGGTPAEDFHWGWDPGTGEEPVHSEAIAYLAPGDDVIGEMYYTYQEQGEYSGQAWVDSYDAYDEPDETNNIAWEDVRVGGPSAVGQADAQVSHHDYQEDGWATFSVQNTGNVALESMQAIVNCGTGPFALHTESRGNQPFLGGWSGRPPGDPRLEAGEGAVLAVDIGDMSESVQCEAEFTFFSEDNAGGLATDTIQVQFTVEVAEEAQEIGAQVSYHDYQEDGWATFSVQNTGNVTLESMQAIVNCGTGPFVLHTEIRGNQPFLGGWSGRPPGDPRLEAGEGAVLAVEIGDVSESVQCEAEFTFFSEDNGGGLSTDTIQVQFVIE